MDNSSRVLVVGTTADYIEWIRRASPGRALFLTLPAVRDEACEPPPAADEEILCDLADEDEVKEKLAAHLLGTKFSLSGIMAFDCESMELAALLAGEYSLTYPSIAAIRRSRDKNATKKAWRANSVRCPESRLVQTAAGVASFMDELGGPCVLKPLTGSGSELVIYCGKNKDCGKATQIISRGLAERKAQRLYSNDSEWFLAEEYVDGDEYSCDFTIRDSQVDIVRITRKIKGDKQPFGTIMGYVLDELPEEAGGRDALGGILKRAAEALGLTDAICMVDFLVADEGIVLLEMTPRPGGDCLPFLMREAGMVDILIFALDFAERRKSVPPVKKDGEFVGLRLHLPESGVLRNIEYDSLPEDPRVLEINIIRHPGHRVSMPPDDYESWFLGHLVFKAAPDVNLLDQCRELRRKIRVEISQ
ncbi:MAG: ATP-grasp domain-containing protein [Proteobacteria bacterium]|nr:ATP-grasp domain-containing protein [Pseudomonadota bacterium]